MLVILGKTASGKTSISNILESSGEFERVITYTTRPRRDGEPMNAYHFIDENEFINKIQNGFFVEWRKYETSIGSWYYGISLESIRESEKEKVLVLTPSGMDAIKKTNIPMISFYIYAPEETLRKRLAIRGDDPEEVDRRISTDNEDFCGILRLVDFIVPNKEGCNISEVANTVKYLYQRKNWKGVVNL